MTKSKSKSWSILLVGLLWTGLAQAQESTNVSGGDAIGSGGTVAYSIGQVIYTSNTSGTGSVAQGVQNAFEIFTIDIKETTINILFAIFPNPTSEDLTLQMSDFDNEKLYYQLHDLQGKPLISGQIIAKQTQINTSNLPSAIYIINVINQENKKVQVFKIVKK
jgi:hypothetical protein